MSVDVDHELAVHLDYLESTGEYVDSVIRLAIAEGLPYLHVIVSFLDVGTRNVLGFMCDVNREGRVFRVGVASEGQESLLVCPLEPFYLLGISTYVEFGRVQIDSMSTKHGLVLTSPVDAEYFSGADMMAWTLLPGVLLSSENPLEIHAHSLDGVIETLRGVLTGSGMAKSYCQNVVTANELLAILGHLGAHWDLNNSDWAGEGGTPRVMVVETMGGHEALSTWLRRKIEVPHREPEPTSQTLERPFGPAGIWPTGIGPAGIGPAGIGRPAPQPVLTDALRLELQRVAPGQGWQVYGPVAQPPPHFPVTQRVDFARGPVS